MKKKAPSKKQSAPGKTSPPVRKTKAAKAGKPSAAARKTKPARKSGAPKAAPIKAAKPVKSKASAQPSKAAKATKSAKAKATKVAKTLPPAKSRPTAARSAKSRASRAAPSSPEREKEALLRSLLAKPAAGDSPTPDEEAVADEPASREEKVGLEKVMASLSQIFGGRDFFSDAELDAFLDSKIASGEIPPSAALDPLDEAQSLIYEAWNSEGPHKTELARRALDLSDACADAYTILAEGAKTREAALELYRKGVDAGKRALDPGIFAKSMGKFWDLMETRPYMRARLGLAECLWDLGQKDEALEHLRDLMRLNPADDQGVRYILLQCLLESGADEELGALLARYGDDTSPEIKFTHALWMFRRQGPGNAADARLRDALKANPHVPDYLLRKRKLSPRIPDAARAGSEEEAEAYASGAIDAWHRTLGAVDWLAGLSRS